MDIFIKAKHGQVARDLQAYTSQKLIKLGRYSQRIISVAVTFDEENSRKKEMQCKVEFQLNVPGQVLHAQETAENCRSAVDLGIETLKKQLIKETDKRSTRLRDEAESAKGVAHSIPPAAVPAPARRGSRAAGVQVQPRLVTERYDLKPMSPEEAIAELGIAKRDFLVFINQGGIVNCIYRRGENQYGLLVPEESA